MRHEKKKLKLQQPEQKERRYLFWRVKRRLHFVSFEFCSLSFSPHCSKAGCDLLLSFFLLQRPLVLLLPEMLFRKKKRRKQLTCLFHVYWFPGGFMLCHRAFRFDSSFLS